MKVAIPVWQGRVSPVFDSSRRMVVLEAEDGRVVERTEAAVDEELPQARAARLRELGVQTLVCGAVSRQLAEEIARLRIRLIAFVAGEVEEVLQAFLTGQLPSAKFSMPGCCGRHRRRRGAGIRGCDGRKGAGRGQ